MTLRLLVYGTKGEVLARIALPVLRVLAVDESWRLFPLSTGHTIFTREGVIDRIVADTELGEVPLTGEIRGTRIWPGCAMDLFTEGRPLLSVERRAGP